MASEYVTFEDLVRFHKEVIAPDLDARMDARMASIDARFVSIDARLDRMTTAMVSIEFGMQEGFNTLHDEIVQTRRDMFTNFDQLWTRFDRVSSDFDPLKQGLRDVETRVTRLENKLL